MATIKDVARLAGVNPSTVSRVFSGKAPVKKETAEKVQRIAEEIGFRFNRAARRLVQGGGSRPLIGLAVPGVTHPFFIEVLKGFTDALEGGEEDYMLFNLGQRPEEIYDRMLAEGLSALVLLSAAPSPEVIREIKAQKIPVVSLDRDHPDFPSVVVNHRAGGRLAAEYLIGKGCKKPFYLGEKFDSPQQRERWEGFTQRWAEAGVSTVAQFKIQQGETPAQEAVRLLLERQDWDGLFCFCDEMAFGAMRALKEARRLLPLVGYDDLGPSRYVGLTTVHQPAFEMGHLGAQMLREAMVSGNLTPFTNVLEPELKIRLT